MGICFSVGIAMFYSLSASAQQTLSLQQAIEEGLRTPAAQIADERVDAFRGLVRQAGLRPNPRIYLQSEDLRPWDDSFSFPNSTEDYGYLGQSFELGRKRAHRVELAKANLLRTQAERDLRKRQIAGMVAASYWAAASTQKIADLLRQDIVAVDEMVVYHKSRVDAGAMRGVDLIRMQIERDRISLALKAAERDASLARIELARQIGRPDAASLQLIDDITALGAPLTFDLQLALAQRIDLTIASDDVQAAEADLKLQHAGAIPDIDLLAGYKRNSGFNTGYTALQLPLPFFNRNQGEIERAKAQVQIARTTLAQAQIIVRTDIQAAQENYQRQLEIVRDTLPEMRHRAKQNLEILTEAYRIGGVDLLRYIDAERTEFDVEVTALRTLTEYHQSVLRLQLATGGQF